MVISCHTAYTSAYKEEQEGTIDCQWNKRRVLQTAGQGVDGITYNSLKLEMLITKGENLHVCTHVTDIIHMYLNIATTSNINTQVLIRMYTCIMVSG